jgi:hypothetical protein
MCYRSRLPGSKGRQGQLVMPILDDQESQPKVACDTKRSGKISGDEAAYFR